MFTAGWMESSVGGPEKDLYSLLLGGVLCGCLSCPLV